MSETKEIFLNVKPFCNEPQLIHMESIVVCNTAFAATFECEEHTANSLKLKRAKFEMYPMPGLYPFGFVTIDAQTARNDKNCRVINFQLELGSEKMEETIEFNDSQEIIWNHNDIIDNHIDFKVGSLTIEREELENVFEKLNLFNKESDFKGNVPTLDRPCKFKLVKEIK